MAEIAAPQQLGGMTTEAHAQAVAQAAAQAVAEGMAVSGVHIFALEDAKGVEHKYMVTEHGVEDGQQILWTLIAMGGEPLGGVMQTAAGRWLAEGGSLGELLDDDSEEGGAAAMLAEVDWAAVGRQISTAVARTNMPGLVSQILRHTTRDGKPLAKKEVYNAAYRANYLEMLQAVGSVLQKNNLIPF